MSFDIQARMLFTTIDFDGILIYDVGGFFVIHFMECMTCATN